LTAIFYYDILSLTRGRHRSGLGWVCALWVFLMLLDIRCITVKQFKIGAHYALLNKIKLNMQLRQWLIWLCNKSERYFKAYIVKQCSRLRNVVDIQRNVSRVCMEYDDVT